MGPFACFAIVSSYRLRPVPRAVLLPVSLLFVIRPVLRHGGRGGVLRHSLSGWLVARFRCLPFFGCGVVSAWRVIISGYSYREGVVCGLCVWGGLLAVPVVYLSCQLVVYIV